MIKKLLTSALITGSVLSGVAQNVGLYPNPNGTSSANKGPNTANRSQITCSIYNSSDFQNDIPSGAQIVFIGWYTSATTNPVTTGNVKIYLQNTSDAVYAKASNTWTNIVQPMTTCYNGTVSIPNSSTPFGVNLTTPFAYTGGNMYMGLEYTSAAGTGTLIPTYYAYSSGDATNLPQTKTGQSTTSSTLPASVGTTASAFKACLVIGYSVAGTDAAVKYVTFGSDTKAGSGAFPVTVTLRNNSSSTLTGGAYTVLVNDGSTTQTITATPTMTASAISTFSGSITAPVTEGLKTYTVTVSAPGDGYPTNDAITATKYIFSNKAVMYEDFNDTAKWKNSSTSAAVMLDNTVIPSGWSLINNDGSVASSTTTGPYFIGTSANNPFFDGQSVSDNYGTANASGIMDDWMVSPQITSYCSANKDSLYFFLKGTSTAYHDSMEVLLSPNGGNTVADFTVSLGVVEAPVAAWTKFSYGLNSVLPAGTTAYRVAFRYHIADAADWGNYISFDCPSVARTNNSVTVNAGGSQNVVVPNNTITATASATNGTVTGTWAQVSGPSATITSSTSASTGVTLTSNGTYCFRYTATDACGNTTSDDACLTLSIPTSIKESAASSLLSLYPNPSNGQFFINTTAIKGSAMNVKITSVEGKNVSEFSSTAGETTSVNIDNLKEGFYFVEVSTNNYKQIFRVVKN